MHRETMNVFTKVYYFAKSLFGLLFLKGLAPLERFSRSIWWSEQIPRNLRPDDSKCVELEKLRKRYSIPNDTFLHIVASFPAVTKKVQDNLYYDSKQKMPNAPEKERLEAVFRRRVFPQNPCGLEITEQEIKKAMQNIDSLEDLKEYFVEMDRREIRFLRDPFGVGSIVANKVDEILES
jgi:hypothetical protein